MNFKTWSPYPKEAYTVLYNGRPAGLGARQEFDERPGLWNLFWLNSVRVDFLLDWSDEPRLAPCDTPVIDLCIQSMKFDCNGKTMESLCEKMEPLEFIATVIKNNYQPPVVQFWAALKRRTWQEFATQRVNDTPPPLPFSNPYYGVNQTLGANYLLQ